MGKNPFETTPYGLRASFLTQHYTALHSITQHENLERGTLRIAIYLGLFKLRRDLHQSLFPNDHRSPVNAAYYIIVPHVSPQQTRN